MSPHRPPQPSQPSQPPERPGGSGSPDPDPDPDLTALLHDAVDDVEPHDARGDLRARIHADPRPKVTPMPGRRSRPWTYAVGGAVVATAAVIAVVAVAGDRLGLTDGGTPTASHGTPADRGTPGTESQEPAGGPSSDGSPEDALPTTRPDEEVTPEPPPTTLAAYYPGPTPQGPRLYREFDRVAAADPLAGALDLLQSSPQDPDYRSAWSPGSFDGATYRAEGGSERIEVSLADGDLRERPDGMGDGEARVAVQQVVYTLQAAVQSRAAVVFELDGQPVDRVYGVDTSSPVTQDPPLDVLALVSISSPVEGQRVTGSLTADGVASSFEATVPWRITRDGEKVKSGFTTAEGWMDKLYPWRTDRIDVSDLAPGSYTFEASTDDPSGGEGPGPYVDTRTIVVE